MRRIVTVLLVSLVVSQAANAASPLQPGDIVVAGYSYDGYPTGACDGAICVIDSAMTTVTPITGAVPTDIGSVTDLAVESPRSVVALARIGFSPPIGTLLHVDVDTGAITTLATALEVHHDASVAAAAGRFFVTGLEGILEIDRISGAASVLMPGSYFGIDAEPGGASLVTARPIPAELCFPYSGCHEFVRIDLATGSATPFEGIFWDSVTEIETMPSGERFVFARSGIISDGMIARTGPGGTTFLGGGETYQASLGGIASDLHGHLLIAGIGHPDPENPFPLIELQRWQQPSNAVVTSFDTDFAIVAIDVAPHRACSNGLDDDGDGTIDWDGGGVGAPDAGCAGNPMRNDEKVHGGGCGLGAELVLLIAALRARSGRR